MVGGIAGPGGGANAPPDGDDVTLNAGEPLLGRGEPCVEAVEARAQRPGQDGQLPLEPGADALRQILSFVGRHSSARVALPVRTARVRATATAYSTLIHKPLLERMVAAKYDFLANYVFNSVTFS